MLAVREFFKQVVDIAASEDGRLTELNAHHPGWTRRMTPAGNTYPSEEDT